MCSGPKHRFLPLNLDWNPKSFSEGKCRQRKTQTAFKKKTKMKVCLQMYSKIEQNTSIYNLKESHSKKIARSFHIDDF